MSYFIAGLREESQRAAAFADMLSDLAPDHQSGAPLCLRSGASYFVGHDTGKAIRDVAIRDTESGSWLVLVGTPLLALVSERDGLSVLRAFFNDPCRALAETFDGNFAVLAYDARVSKLIAATDFNSTVPIFYSSRPEGVLCASQELALAKLVGLEIDPLGFAQSIHMGVTWGPHTRFQGMQKLLPCQVAYFSSHGLIKTEHYWRPQQEATGAGNFEEHLDKWLRVLSNAVSMYYECSDRKPVITDFTAGEDGRLLVAQCHALGIPFKAHVTGLEGETDVIIARQAAKTAGFELIVRKKHQVSTEQLLSDATKISLRNDAYQEFFKSCTEFATEAASPLDDYTTVKYCGLPGGEAFRGSYYLRGKVFFPSRRGQLDRKFFTKLKFLLDFHPGLLKGTDQEFLCHTDRIVDESLADVTDFPMGTQIDHIVRLFQTSLLGLKYKNPLYLPYATKSMTRSVYWLSPLYKRGGRLTKACTEVLFPELAVVKTQNGVPTIRKTVARIPLFMPEYIATAKKISSGTFSRLLKWAKPNKWYYSDEWTAHIFTTLLNERPYSKWFSSPDAMATGYLYDPQTLRAILSEAKTGVSNCVPILSRIINNELAYRWASRQ